MANLSPRPCSHWDCCALPALNPDCTLTSHGRLFTNIPGGIWTPTFMPAALFTRAEEWKSHPPQALVFVQNSSVNFNVQPGLRATIRLIILQNWPRACAWTKRAGRGKAGGDRCCVDTHHVHSTNSSNRTQRHHSQLTRHSGGCLLYANGSLPTRPKQFRENRSLLISPLKKSLLVIGDGFAL